MEHMVEKAFGLRDLAFFRQLVVRNRLVSI